MAKGRGHIPIRTCVSCGEKRNKRELIRFVIREEDRLVRDDLGRYSGRGAYVCHARSCLEKLLKNRGLHRIFRRGKALAPESVRLFVEEMLKD
jgi:predicted RNA-binding protein YlxR (DUF448 family)